MPRITLLGTSGAGGVPGRAQNCILVETNDATLLLDSGPGCGARLREKGVKPCEIDAIYISHLHLDHWSGVFDVAVQAVEEQCRLPQIILPDPLLGEGASLLAGVLPRSLRSTASITGFSVSPLARTARLVESLHTIPCYGVIIETGDARVYYSSDTSLNERLKAAVGEADVAIVEATMPTGLEEAARATGHLTVSQALSLLEHVKPGSLLVLTHFSRESLGELARLKKAPKSLVIPYDHTAIVF